MPGAAGFSPRGSALQGRVYRELHPGGLKAAARIWKKSMLLARVIGTVVSSQKEASMEGLRFMLVQPVDMEGKAAGAQVVAVDAVGSGTGEMVMVATGSSARQTRATDKRPCDAVIMAIVDTVEIRGEMKYQKNKDTK